MTDPEWKLVQEVAASAARASDIVLAADKLAEAAKALVTVGYKSKHATKRFERALQDYEVVRTGQ